MDFVTLVLDTLRADSGLAAVQEWQPAAGMNAIRTPCVYVGVAREDFAPDTRRFDRARAEIKIGVWLRERDPAKGEADVRNLAWAVRYALTEHRTLGGRVDGGFVSRIEYLSVDVSDRQFLHLAEITFEVDYAADRARPVTMATVAQVSADVGPEGG